MGDFVVGVFVTGDFVTGDFVILNFWDSWNLGDFVLGDFVTGKFFPGGFCQVGFCRWGILSWGLLSRGILSWGILSWGILTQYQAELLEEDDEDVKVCCNLKRGRWPDAPCDMFCNIHGVSRYFFCRWNTIQLNDIYLIVALIISDEIGINIESAPINSDQ